MGSSPIGHPTNSSTSPRKWRQPAIDCGGTPGAACRLLVDAALAHISANLAGAIEARDPEYLHQLRVGIRRLRTLLRIFKHKRLDRRLRKLVLPLGAARDWDVFVARFGNGGAAQRVAHARCRRLLRGRRFEALLLELRRLESSGDAPLEAFAGTVLERLRRKALKRARGIDWGDEKQRHAVRIAVRRLRYACDFFAPCFADGRSYARRLAKLQDLLGELNDITVARRLGAPRAALGRRERALISQLAPAWRSWAGTGIPRAAAT